uniref:Uncharacterized protein n=1 Tax=Panagrolaimus sp. ES5 TaxID=591445 RepID=A0AC34GK52_9BILA
MLKRLCVESVPKTTTGEEIAEAVKANVDKIIVKSVVGVTRDGGSNVKKSCRLLGYADVHCFDHVLNIGIVFAYKFSIAYVLIEKVKTLSGVFAKSPTATIHLKECGAKYSMKTASNTRWNWMGRVIKCVLQ